MNKDNFAQCYLLFKLTFLQVAVQLILPQYRRLEQNYHEPVLKPVNN